jgi:valyl-tRNA synthetase
MDNTQDQKTEQEWYQYWEENGFFKADPSSAKTPYSILMPPPNVNGALHLGHAMQHAIMDAMARFKRMQGLDVLLLPGVDHAGILFESTLNRNLSREGLSKETLGREEWMKKAWQFKDEVYNSFHNTWKIFGLSADWSREVFTLEPKVQKAVLKEFQTFWDQGLLYKGAYIVQWCPKDQTAIEDVEMEYEEKTEKLYYIKYRIEDSDQTITIATARPETIAADVAIAVYPNHPQYKELVGKNALNPFTNTKLPIIEDDRVETEFGTGALKITPGHDLLDYEIGKDHSLPILHVVAKNGLITELDPDLAELPINEAREKADKKLEDEGLIEKVEEYTHSVPVCERCKTTIEPLISEEWFVKMAPLAEKGLKNLSKVNIVPKNYQKILSDWMEEIHDWSISRSLWWGHRIPVWYCTKCNGAKEVGSDKGMIISLDKPENPCPICSASEWVQDEQVLDTWFSSGMWPMATLGWPDETTELNRYYPWDFELSGGDIKYLWIARMIMLGLHFRDKIPFKNMFFHGQIRDLQGRKFSKSLGNGIDPNELRVQWGTDPVRMSLYTYSAPGRDGRASKQTMEERAKNYRNFVTKLKNIIRFIIDLKPEYAQIERPEKWTHKDDKDIVKKLDAVVENVTHDMESFNLHLATEALYDFIWHQFADIYIEKTKERRGEAQPCLEYVFKTSLELLHPFMPFITEELWQKLIKSNMVAFRGEPKSIMLAAWPEVK